MKCILNENVALRSWRLVPHAFYIRGDRDAHGLSGEAFELLCRCDGKQDIESAEELKKIGEEIGVVIRCQHEDIFNMMHRI